MKTLTVVEARLRLPIPSRWSQKRTMRASTKDTQLGQFLRWWMWVTDANRSEFADSLGCGHSTINQFFISPVHEKHLVAIMGSIVDSIGASLEATIDELVAMSETQFVMPPDGTKSEWQEFAQRIQNRYFAGRPS